VSSFGENGVVDLMIVIAHVPLQIAQKKEVNSFANAHRSQFCTQKFAAEP
jgi:hypothetical protein